MGRSKTPEATREKQRAAKLGKPFSEERRAKMRGKRMSQETKDKISAACKGRRLTVPQVVARSLAAMLDGRGHRLNKALADDPVLRAETIAKRGRGRARAFAEARQERAQAALLPNLQATLGPSRLGGLIASWEATRDLTKLQPPRFR